MKAAIWKEQQHCAPPSPEARPPLDREELNAVAGVPLEVRAMLGEERLDVVPHDVGVADDGGVVDDLANAVHHEHDVRDVGKAI